MQLRIVISSQVGLFIAGATVMLALTGCRQETARVYEVPKETWSPEEPPAPTWVVPQGWRELEASGMRAGSFSALGPNGGVVDVSIIPLPAGMGDELANLNRWRGQLGLAPVGAEDMSKLAEPVTVDGEVTRLYAMESQGPLKDGSPASSILATLLPRYGKLWFFKMMGPVADVEAQRAAFLEFLGSVRFGAGQAPSRPAVQKSESTSSAGLTYKSPSHWEERPASGMRQAYFVIGGASDRQAEVTVIRMGPASGDLLPNINRWRGQVQLAPLGEGDLAAHVLPLEGAAVEAMLVDVGGSGITSPALNTLAAILKSSDATWFVKLTGDAGLVGQEREAFLEFTRSLGLSK